jgi:uncharacterized surface protein with fasciclin (FAS1) repeats
MICPLDKDISMMKNMIKQGVNAEWVAKFYLKTGSLMKMLKYYKELKALFDYLPPYVSKMGGQYPSGGGGKGIGPSSGVGTCTPTNVEEAVSRVFCEDEGDDLFTLARKNNGGYFIDLLWASGLANDLLRSGEEYTLLVPTDASFKRVSKKMRERMKDNCYLKNLLSYHVSRKEKTSTAVQTSSKDLKSNSQGKMVFYAERDGKSMYGGSTILKRDLKATNGNVQILNDVMIPPQQTVVSILDANNNFKIFTNALRKDALAEELRNLNGPFTIFAPKDDRIENDASLKMKISDPTQLREFVRDHIVEGIYYGTLFEGDQEVILTSLSGKDITLRNNAMSRRLSANGVSVNQSDIRGTNGLVHIVDDVIRK